MSWEFNLKGRDFISTQDWSRQELQFALDTAADLKRKFKVGEPTRYLQDRTLFMIFFDKSTRTRNSFEAGITQLGGHGHFIESQTSQIAHGESPKDMGIILSTYGHGIAIRHDLVPGQGNAYIREVAKWADIPVYNMQCDVDHPFQMMADLMTIQERFSTRSLRGMKIAVSWAYAPSYAKPLSVPQGLIMLMTRFGADVTLARPKEFALMPETVEAARANAAKSGGSLRVVEDMDEAVQSAHVVYAKSWGALGYFDDKEGYLKLAAKYKDWRVDNRRMGMAAPEGVYMHCLPADRNNEVTDEVLDGPRSVIYQEAENRLHTAKAIMALTMR